MDEQISNIESLIGTDDEVAEEIIKYCQQVKTKSKILNMKSYVLENLDKIYDLPIIEQYLDKITELKHKVLDNVLEFGGELTRAIIVDLSFKINKVFVKLECENVEYSDDFKSKIRIRINGKTIMSVYTDEVWENCYYMIKKDSNITNFNLEHYNKLHKLSECCSSYGSIDKDYYEQIDFDETEYIDYDEKDYKKKDTCSVLDLKVFVEVCKKDFPDVNPIQLFDVIMLCLIYCYKLDK